MRVKPIPMWIIPAILVTGVVAWTSFVTQKK